MRTDRLYSMASALLVIVCVLATHPVLEMGFNDDWSYTWVARGLAATGHFTLTGWIGAMIGVQAVWAALLIRLFGFSFTLVRLSTLPFAAGCAVLLYSLARRAGLNARYAFFAATTITLSPVFIPLSASYMTDIPGFFFWLAACDLALRAAESIGARRASVWLAAAALAGIAGGTVRQVVWAVPLLVLPAVGWIRRKERAVVASAAWLWGATVVASAFSMLWFGAQPNNLSGVLAPDPQDFSDLVSGGAEASLQIAVGTLMLLLPVLTMHATAWRRWLGSPSILACCIAAPAGLLSALVWGLHGRLLVGNIITNSGVLGQWTEAMGAKPEILTPPIRILLAASIVIFAGITCAVLWNGVRDRGWKWRSVPIFWLVVLPPSLAYALAILYRAVHDWLLFDRYLIVLLPVLVIALLLNFQNRIRRAPPAIGWILVGAFAAYGIATTHDSFARSRARLEAASTLTAAGIPRTQITAGLEYDGWTELEHSGHVTTAEFPDDPAERTKGRYPLAPSDWFWFWARTPSIDPEYFVVYSRVNGLEDAPFRPVPYTTWFPPFHREILIQRARGLQAAR